MSTKKYTILDLNNICTKVILADSLEDAKIILGENAMELLGAEVGWQYNPETESVFDPKNPNGINPYESQGIVG